MIKWYSSILLALVSFTINAQIREYTVSFDNPQDEYSFSLKYASGIESDVSFVGITAYTLAEGVEASIYYRERVDGYWQGWKEMHLFDESETAGRTVYEGEPIYSTFDSIQFRSNTSSSASWKFRLFSASNELNSSYDVEEITSILPCAMPSICDRDCWCDTCPKDNTPTPTIPTHLIIHHSAGFSSAPDYKQVMAYYWDFHVNTNGWDDIGYNWLIDPNGVIYEGRGSNTSGAHFSCMNSNTLGICMIGNYVSNAPSDTALRSLEALLAYEAYQNNIDPDGISYHSTSQLTLYNISSHRDGNGATAPGSCPKGTVCPGDTLYALLPVIRQNVNSKPCMDGIGIADYKQKKASIFPNPTESEITIVASDEQHLDGIYDITGKKLIDLTAEQGEEVRVDVSSLPRGMYLVKFEGELQKTLKLLKK